MTRTRFMGRNGLALLQACLVAPALLLAGLASGQESAPTTEAKATEAPKSKRRSDVDLHALLTRERARLEAEGIIPEGAVLSIKATGDGTLEVRNSAGELLETFTPDGAGLSGTVSAAAIEDMNAARAAEAEAVAALRKAETEAKEQAAKAQKAKEEAKQKAVKEQEVKWHSDFAAKSEGYTDRKNRSKIKAVKIDAREIKEDGTYIYEGKPMKPVRLWNDRRGQFEMAIPVPETKPES